MAAIKMNDKGTAICIESPAKSAPYNGKLYYSYNNRTASLIESFNDFMSKLITTDIQNEVVFSLVEKLLELEVNTEIGFEKSIEDEIILIYRNPKGINFISVDIDGDIMVSVSPFKGDGAREFYDSNSHDAESVIFTFLSVD